MRAVIILFIQMLTYIQANRNINLTVNPYCVNDCEKPWVVYVEAVGKKSTVHYLWGTIGAPVFIIETTQPEVTLNIDWVKLQDVTDNSGSIQFSPSDVPPNSVFAVAIPEIILFNDNDDDGKMDSNDERVVVPMNEFDWEITEVNVVHLVLQTTHYKQYPLENGTKIAIKLTAFDGDGRSPELPKLITTPDSSQFELTLQNLDLGLTNATISSFGASSMNHSDHRTTPISGYSHPRWALNMVVFTDEKEESGIKFSSHKSLDDEYSPGVFHLDEITTLNARKENGGGGYLQWRPICYLNDKRDFNSATFPNIVEPLQEYHEFISLSIKNSLMNAVFPANGQLLMGSNTTVSFGQSKDGYYTETNYLMWTVAMGHGTPPKEGFSLLIIIVISLGVGIPILLFMLGGIGIFVRNRRSSGELLINS